ncbi:MAG: sugar-binding domain-containing protein [Actinomycetaceae bacterium]|nr:sugar-binding domain-containing protein [Actinomycetaceae bacterium]
MANQREEKARQAATMYYLEDLTMETIARKLSMSRSSVSRLLAYARQAGIVTISIAAADDSVNIQRDAFYRLWSVRAHIIPVPRHTPALKRLRYVCKVAAQDLADIIQPHDTVGLAWGNTTTELVGNLPQRTIPHVTFVQLNGAASTEVTAVPHAEYIIGVAAQSFNAHSIQFPAPAFFDNPETKQAMWKESSIRRVLEIRQQCDIAVFGIGSLEAEVPSRVYAGGYFTHQELLRMEAQNVAGDVCTLVVREDGSWSDIEFNQRTTGPTPEELSQIPRRMAVVADRSKSRAIIGALNAGVITDLYIDDISAGALLKRVETTHALRDHHR